MLELNPDSFVIYAMAEGFKPDPMLTVSEWADENRYLSSVASSEPGRWHTERTPYLKEIMDCLSPSDLAHLMRHSIGTGSHLPIH